MALEEIRRQNALIHKVARAAKVSRGKQSLRKSTAHDQQREGKVPKVTLQKFCCFCCNDDYHRHVNRLLQNADREGEQRERFCCL